MADLDPLAVWLKELGVSFPFFVRAVQRAGASGEGQKTIEGKASVILEEVLDPDGTEEISVYSVSSGDEILKLAMTLRLFRHVSESRVYVITTDDLKGLPYDQSEANCNIPCFWTRSHHYDLRLNQSQRELLALRLADK